MANKVEINISVNTNDEKSVQNLKKDLQSLIGLSEEIDSDVKVDDSELKDVEKEFQSLNRQQIQAKIDADSKELEDVNKQIEKVKSELKELEAKPDVDDTEIQELKKELSSLEEKGKSLEFDIKVGTEGLSDAKRLLDSAVQNAMQNISQGFGILKQGASELGQVMEDALNSAGKQETNKQFLEMAIGPEKAEKSMQKIRDIVNNLPGDDTALQGLLSSAVASESSLANNDKLMNQLANSATDYFSAMSFYGKNATEAQQDMTNYLLAGNTAELERSPILQKHLDKLKEANTLEERSTALAEALKEEHWAGMGAAETFNNKLETFNGMLDRGKYTLGGMFQEGAKGAMDIALKLDDITGGFFGMGLAAASFASPLSDMVVGAGQAALGIKTLRDVYKDLTIAETIANAIEGEGAIAHIASALGITTEATAAEGATIAFGGLAIAEGAALWYVLAFIAALALIGAAVYEVGKYFGWWTDVGSMIDAVTGGVKRLWSAFINNPNVQGFIKDLTNLWDGLCDALSPVTDWAKQVWNEMFPPVEGEVDVVRMIIDAFGALGRIFGDVVNGIKSMYAKFGILGAIIGVIQAPTQAIVGILRSVICALLGCSPGIVPALQRVQEVFSSVFSFIAGFIGSVIGTIVSIIMTIVTAVQNVITIFSWFLNGQISITDMVVMLWNNFSAMFTSILNILVGFVSGWGGRIRQIIISTVQGWISNAVSGARNLVSSVHSALSELPGKVSSAVSGITSKFTQPFKDAWGIISPYIDKIKEGIDFIGDHIPSFGFEGVSFGFTGESFGWEGIDNLDTLNSTLTTTSNGLANKSTITNNFNINGIIEEEASEYIVGAVNDHIRKQNLIRGV